MRSHPPSIADGVIQIEVLSGAEGLNLHTLSGKDVLKRFGVAVRN